ncbi:MAG: alpha/beta hydrolase [Desulfobacterales bacterium]
MNRFAYRTTSLVIKALSGLSKAEIRLHDTENIPKAPSIFVINHFTRIETFLMPYHINRLTGIPVWSLASSSLFVGPLGKVLDHVGAVSTKDPDRDRLIVKSLLTGEAHWIIFPEGRMVKNKKIVERGRFMISHAGGKYPPHTGAATLALRTEFYRQRLLEMAKTQPDEAARLLSLFEIEDIASVLDRPTQIVPVNITYYPVRTRENLLSNLANKLVDDLPDRVTEEIMTEGTMLLSGVGVDIRFGRPISVREFMGKTVIHRDISGKQRIDFDDAIASKLEMRKTALRIMQRYMADIYNMTTVNHDHLFAAMLRKLPSNRIREKVLRQKVFLAAIRAGENKHAFLHKSLQRDQTPLLTDDRFHKYRNFIDLAIDTGAVKKGPKGMTRALLNFTPPFDFHRVRIDNPVAVMANAIEPLTDLQRTISRLSWQPQAITRYRIRKHLLEEELTAFNEDYKAFYVPGESKEKDIGKPFLIKGKTRNVGVVLFHGYMAAPMEMKGLADYLGKLGLWVYVPRIKGHGTSPDDLVTRTMDDWILSADRGYAIISSICKHVVVGGFSNGGGLALDMAARIEDVGGMFAVCPSFKLQDLAAKFVPTLDMWNKFMDKIRLDSAKMTFVDNHPENPHINYTRNPISGIRELDRLMESLEPKLPEIKQPALIVQSDGDPVVDPDGSRQVFDLLGSQDKTYRPFTSGRHGILLGEGSEQVYRTIGEFIMRLAGKRNG